MPIPITGLYAGLLTLVSLWLGFGVGSMRNKTGISILHGDNMELAEKIRRHANFTENVPLALILMAVIELGGAASGLIHGLGGLLVIARICHPLGLHHDNMRHPLRAIGAFGTLLMTVVAAFVAIWQYAN